MSINDINNAAAAMNALKVRYEGFLDDADDQIGARQAAFDALAADLFGVVNARMSVKITFDPTAEAANLSPGGVFRTWPEFLAFVNPLPEGACVQVRMEPGQLVVTQNYYSHIYGNRHFDFRANTNQPAGARPSILLPIYDKVNFNQWYNLRSGSLGSFYGQYIDIYFAEDVNEAVNPSSNNTAFIGGVRGEEVQLNNCMVKGPEGTHLMTATSGSIAMLSLNGVLLDGISYGLNQVSSRGVALLACDSVTVANGAAIYSPAFTVGEDLITSVVTV